MSGYGVSERTWFDRMRILFYPLDWILENPTKVVFHHVPNATRPDSVLVYAKDDPENPIYKYHWIEGHEALPASKLGRVHSHSRKEE